MTQRKPAVSPAPLSLFLSGDVMTGRGIDQALPHPGDPRLHESYLKSALDYVALAREAHGPIATPVAFAHVWGAALQELESARPDLRIINLETSVTSSDTYDRGKEIHYRMHPRNAPVLSAARIDCCALANNHVLDWGAAGLLETLGALDAAGIKHAGAGRTRDEAFAPALLERPGGGRVLFFSVGSRSSGIPAAWAATGDRAGVAVVDEDSAAGVREIRDRVRRIEQPGDVVVVSIHWGSNWGYAVRPQERDFARRLIDEAGVDIVHGHSSHHFRGIEVHGERLILYGCGDFLNDYEGISGFEEYRPDLALMYLAKTEPTSGRLLELRLVPLRIANFRLNRAAKDDARWVREVLNREGRELGTRADLQSDGSLLLRWN